VLDGRKGPAAIFKKTLPARCPAYSEFPHVRIMVYCFKFKL